MKTQMTKRAEEIGLKVVAQEAKRLAKFKTCSDTPDDLVGEGNKMVCEAWATFDPNKGEWQKHCRMYVRLYQKRFTNKAKSVVTTDYDNRHIERDDAMLAQDEESGEWVTLDFADPTDRHAQHDARLELNALYARFMAAVVKVEEKYQPVARALVDVAFERDDRDMSQLTKDFGLSRPTTYKVKKTLWALVGINLDGNSDE